MRELKGTTCLVTGCSTGIGRATARALAAAGARVFATARDRSAIAELAGDGIETLALDVRDPAAVEAALEATGPVGVLVNNAGFGIEGAVEEIGDADLRDQYETNVFGVWRLCRAVLPGMRERATRDDRQRLVVRRAGAVPGIGAYRSSKFALEGLTWTLRLEVAHFGIRVLSVQPGLTASRFGGSMRRGEHFDPDGPYAPMRASAAVTYAQMSPTALEPETVADAIVAAIGAEHTPWRIRVGDDARRMTASVESGDGCLRARARRGPRVRLASAGQRVKVALVTGAASGIGRATARLFAEAGYGVVAADRNGAGLAETLADVEHGVAVQGDVSVWDDAERMVEAARERFGRLDAVACIAGIEIDRPVDQLAISDWDAVVDTSLKGTYLVCRAAVPLLR